MKILILDTGLAEELARRLAVEGHEVKIWIPEQSITLDEGLHKFGEGLFEKLGIEKISAPEEHLDWPDLVVATDVVFAGEVTLFRNNGIPVVGSSQEGYDLELKREEGKKLFDEIAMPVPECWSFDKVEDAIEKVEELNSPVVVRFGGITVGNLPRTNVCMNPEAAIDILYQAAEKKPDEIMIQEFKEGYEIAAGGYFNGKDFYLMNINWEYKRLFPGDIGPLTGDMGSVVTFDPEYLAKASKLIEYVKVCSGKLAEVGYVGYFDINSIYVAEEDEFYALEFTVRPGYPTDFVLQSVVENWGEFLYAVATGNHIDVEVSSLWAVGVAYAACGYGFEPPEVASAIVGLTLPELTKPSYYKQASYIAIEEVMYDDDTETVRLIPNFVGRTLICIGKGQTLKEAVDNAYNDCVCKVYIHDGYYRNDIGSRVEEFLCEPDEL